LRAKTAKRELQGSELVGPDDLIRLSKKLLQHWVGKVRSARERFDQQLRIRDDGYRENPRSEASRRLLHEHVMLALRQSRKLALEPLQADFVAVAAPAAMFRRATPADVRRAAYRALCSFSQEAITSRDPDNRTCYRFSLELGRQLDNLVADRRVSRGLTVAWVDDHVDVDFERIPDVLWWTSHSAVRCDDISYHGRNRRLESGWGEPARKLCLTFEASIGAGAAREMRRRVTRIGRVLLRLVDELQHDPVKRPATRGLPTVDLEKLDRYSPLLTRGFELFFSTPPDELTACLAASMHLLYETESAINADTRTVLLATAAEAVVCETDMREISLPRMRPVVRSAQPYSLNERFSRRLAVACCPNPNRLDAVARSLRDAYLRRGKIAHGAARANTLVGCVEGDLRSAVAQLHWAVCGWLSSASGAKRTQQHLIGELDACWQERKPFVAPHWRAEWNGADLSQGRHKYPCWTIYL
jgi:hypothetical protein